MTRLTVVRLTAQELRRHEGLLRDTGAVSDIDDPGPQPVPAHTAVAYEDDKPVGCLRIRPLQRADYVVADLRGGVQPHARGRGVGSALIDWFCEEGVNSMGSRFVEAVVDDGACDEALKRILLAKGFAAVEFHEMSVPTCPGSVATPPGITIRTMQEADIPIAAALYSAIPEAQKDVEQSRADVLAAWNSPYVSRHESLLVYAGDIPRGFALSFRWPDDPHDLWIECLSVGAPAQDPAGEVARSLLDALRATPAPTETVSTGVEVSRSLALELAGFRINRRWRRFRQVLIA